MPPLYARHWRKQQMMLCLLSNGLIHACPKIPVTWASENQRNVKCRRTQPSRFKHFRKFKIFPVMRSAYGIALAFQSFQKKFLDLKLFELLDTFTDLVYLKVKNFSCEYQAPSGLTHCHSHWPRQRKIWWLLLQFNSTLQWRLLNFKSQFTDSRMCCCIQLESVFNLKVQANICFWWSCHQLLKKSWGDCKTW